MGIGKICRLYNISHQVGLTDSRLPSDSEVISYMIIVSPMILKLHDRKLFDFTLCQWSRSNAFILPGVRSDHKIVEIIYTKSDYRL